MKRKRIAIISMVHIEDTGELEGKKSLFEDTCFFFKAKEIHDKTQVGLNWKYPISELIKLRFTR